MKEFVFLNLRNLRFWGLRLCVVNIVKLFNVSGFKIETSFFILSVRGRPCT